MSAKTQWRVIDEQGGFAFAPDVRDICGNYTCDYGLGAVYERERDAVVAWAVKEGRSIAEVVAPGALSADERERAMQVRCLDEVDELFGFLQRAAEGDGCRVEFVIDDAGGTDMVTMSADRCEEVLDGVRLAASAINLMDDEVEG